MLVEYVLFCYFVFIFLLRIDIFSSNKIDHSEFRACKHLSLLVEHFLQRLLSLVRWQMDCLQHDRLLRSWEHLYLCLLLVVRLYSKSLDNQYLSLVQNKM